MSDTGPSDHRTGCRRGAKRRRRAVQSAIRFRLKGVGLGDRDVIAAAGCRAVLL